jgi:hypothetical protein
MKMSKPFLAKKISIEVNFLNDFLLKFFWLALLARGFSYCLAIWSYTCQHQYPTLLPGEITYAAVWYASPSPKMYICKYKK